MNTIRTPTLLAIILVLSFAPVSPGGAGSGKIALLVQNRVSEKYDVDVDRLSDLLASGLRERKMLTLVERPRVEAAVQALGLPSDRSPTAAEATRLAKSLGAGAAIASDFTIDAYQLEARLLEVSTGQSLARQVLKGQKGEIFDIVDALSGRLASSLKGLRSSTRTVAVLYFENLAAADYDLFARGISDMLTSNLQTSEGIGIVERAQIDRGMEQFALEPGQRLTATEASALGKWLGADVVVTGSFTEIFRLDARLIDARNGAQLAEFAAADVREATVDLVGNLAQELMLSLGKLYRETRTVAVLYFENHTSEKYESFVHGFADMLITTLGQSAKLTLIERVQIDRAMANFHIELNGPIDTETAVEVGAWLGADAVVLGSFVAFGETYRIDARLIDAQTGELLVAQNVRGPEENVIAMVDQLGLKLVESVDDRRTELEGGTGTLRIRFKTTKSEMGERPVYYHICKLYVDGKYMGMSPIVRQTDDWAELFSKSLRAGKHAVEVVHGYVKHGDWDGKMPLQPRTFQVTIEPEIGTTLEYFFQVGWFEDQFVYGGS